MNDLGTLLRQARENRGVTLAQAEKDTHIRQAYLLALEENRRDALPDLVYVRGLVSNYSRYLGVDKDEARQLLVDTHGRPPADAHAIGSHQPLSEPLHVRQRGWMAAAIWILLLASVAITAWWFWPSLKPWGRWVVSGGLVHLAQRAMVPPSPVPRNVSATATFEAAGAATAYALPTANPTEMAGVGEPLSPGGETPAVSLPPSSALPLPTPTTRPSATAPVVPTATPTRQAGIVAAVEATSPSWVRVTADRQVIYEGTLQTGDKKQWSATQSLQLLTGNAGGTVLSVNGGQPATMGDAGAVANRLWVMQGQSVVEATPPPQS